MGGDVGRRGVVMLEEEGWWCWAKRVGDVGRRWVVMLGEEGW